MALAKYFQNHMMESTMTFDKLLEAEEKKLKVLTEDYGEVTDFSDDPNFSGSGDYVVDADTQEIVNGPFDPASDDATSWMYNYQLSKGRLGSAYVVTLGDDGIMQESQKSPAGKTITEEAILTRDFSKADVNAAYQAAYDDGEGFAVGTYGDDINELGDELNAALVMRAMDDEDMAVYITRGEDRIISVCYDEGKLWAVDITDYLNE